MNLANDPAGAHESPPPPLERTKARPGSTRTPPPGCRGWPLGRRNNGHNRALSAQNTGPSAPRHGEGPKAPCSSRTAHTMDRVLGEAGGICGATPGRLGSHSDAAPRRARGDSGATVRTSKPTPRWIRGSSGGGRGAHRTGSMGLRRSAQTNSELTPGRLRGGSGRLLGGPGATPGLAPGRSRLLRVGAGAVLGRLRGGLSATLGIVPGPSKRLRGDAWATPGRREGDASRALVT